MISFGPAPTPNPDRDGACVLVTGATGFLGKVVLEELLRRRHPLNVCRVVCLVRPRRGATPEERFAKQVRSSPCFGRLPDGWHQRVDIVEGELTEPLCGMNAANHRALAQDVTHIVHCAASVDFTRPLREAARANIQSSLEVLELARACPHLRGMVSTSTAYVSPHRLGPIAEALEPLPRPASVLWDAIQRPDVDEAQLLAETGHPNTYTYTKCVAEHLLCERRGGVPLAIVRPSIISASWAQPFPGWIDSRAAFAGFVASIGGGHLRVLDADPRALLDLVPVDVVADRLIAAAFSLHGNGATPRVPILYAVSGSARADCIGNTSRGIVAYFRRNAVGRRPHVAYVGARGRRYALAELVHHRAPATVMQWGYALGRNNRQRRRAQRLAQSLDQINHMFAYFTHHTFDFRPSIPLPPDFDPKAYVRLVCHGVYTYLMRRNAHEVPIGGARFRARYPDWLWALSRAQGNLTTRATAAMARKVVRRVFDEVTFDRHSFDVAMQHTGSNPRWVIVPTHRSYFDFLLCAYLFLARPDLGLRLPHMAAAPALFEVPMLAGWLRRIRAFARPHPQAPATVARLVRANEVVACFIEPERSRSRQFMPPDLGVLRGLNVSGFALTLLPIAISYDRIAEETPFMRELRGQARTPLSPRSLMAWARRMVGRRVHLGRVHISCGAPQTLDAHSNLAAVGQNLMAQLQRHTVATTFHLTCFVHRHPELDIGVDWLRRAIVQRGGTVLTSPLAVSAVGATATLERSLRHHWQHYFFADARAMAPDNEALIHYIAANSFAPRRRVPPTPPAGVDPRLLRLLHALFAPVCADYAAITQAALDLRRRNARCTAQSLLQSALWVDYPTARLALRAHLNEGLLQAASPRVLRAFIDGCAWPAVAGGEPLSARETSCPTC